MISIDHISKWYGQFQVLNDCTTNVEKGEVIVVCGPSGSGKSTLIYIVIAMTANRVMAYVEKRVAVPGYIAGGGK